MLSGQWLYRCTNVSDSQRRFNWSHWLFFIWPSLARSNAPTRFFRSIDLTDALAGSLLALAMQSPMHCPFIFNIIGFTSHLISADARPIRLGCHLDTSTTNWTSWIWFGLHPCNLEILQIDLKLISSIDYVVIQSSKSQTIYGLIGPSSLHPL